MYSKQSNSAASSQAFLSDQAVQTKVEDGQWMLLADAADAIGVSEKTISRYIKKRLLKSRSLGKLSNSPKQVWITPETLKKAKDDQDSNEYVEVFDAEADDTDDVVESFSPQDNQPPPSSERAGTAKQFGPVDVETVVRAIAQQFAEKLDEQKEVIVSMRHELHQKDTQLRLLPDLQRKLEEREKASDFESKALQKQVDELKLENERLREEAEAAKRLVQQKQNWWTRLFSSTNAPAQS